MRSEKNRPLCSAFSLFRLLNFRSLCLDLSFHYSGVIMGAIASQITSLTIIYSIVYSGADQRKHQISASLAFVRGIHRRPVISPHKWSVTRKRFPFDDVIMFSCVIGPYDMHADLFCIALFLFYQLSTVVVAGRFSFSYNLVLLNSLVPGKFEWHFRYM